MRIDRKKTDLLTVQHNERKPGAGDTGTFLFAPDHIGNCAQNNSMQGEKKKNGKKISTYKMSKNGLINEVIHIIHIKMSGLVKYYVN